MPVFTASDIPGKNITWVQFLYVDNADASVLGSKATYTVATGKIARVKEVNWTEKTGASQVQVRVRPNGAATQARYAVASSGGAAVVAGTPLVQTRETACIAGDVIEVFVSATAAGSVVTVIVSGELADA